MKKITVAALIISSMTALIAKSAFAHSVQTDYLLSPDSSLSLDVTYSTGDPVPSTPVKIYAPNNPNEPWKESTTDENGKFNFLPDSAIEGEWTVKIGEYDHGDILSVPVNKNGIDVNSISQDLPQATVASRPLQLGAEPANADEPSSVMPPAALTTNNSHPGISFELFLTLCLGGLAGLSLWGWKMLKRS